MSGGSELHTAPPPPPDVISLSSTSTPASEVSSPLDETAVLQACEDSSGSRAVEAIPLEAAGDAQESAPRSQVLCSPSSSSRFTGGGPASLGASSPPFLSPSFQSPSDRPLPTPRTEDVLRQTSWLSLGSLSDLGRGCRQVPNLLFPCPPAFFSPHAQLSKRQQLPAAALGVLAGKDRGCLMRPCGLLPEGVAGAPLLNGKGTAVNEAEYARSQASSAEARRVRARKDLTEKSRPASHLVTPARWSAPCENTSDRSGPRGLSAREAGLPARRHPTTNQEDPVLFHNACTLSSGGESDPELVAESAERAGVSSVGETAQNPLSKESPEGQVTESDYSRGRGDGGEEEAGAEAEGAETGLGDAQKEKTTHGAEKLNSCLQADGENCQTLFSRKGLEKNWTGGENVAERRLFVTKEDREQPPAPRRRSRRREEKRVKMQGAPPKSPGGWRFAFSSASRPLCCFPTRRQKKGRAGEPGVSSRSAESVPVCRPKGKRVPLLPASSATLPGSVEAPARADTPLRAPDPPAQSPERNGLSSSEESSDWKQEPASAQKEDHTSSCTTSTTSSSRSSSHSVNTTHRLVPPLQFSTPVSSSRYSFSSAVSSSSLSPPGSLPPPAPSRSFAAEASSASDLFCSSASPSSRASSARNRTHISSVQDDKESRVQPCCQHEAASLHSSSLSRAPHEAHETSESLLADQGSPGPADCQAGPGADVYGFRVSCSSRGRDSREPGESASALVALPNATSRTRESLAVSSSEEQTACQLTGRTMKTRGQVAAASKEDSSPTAVVEERSSEKREETSFGRSHEGAADGEEGGRTDCRSVEDVRQRGENLARSVLAETAKWGRPSQWLRPRADASASQRTVEVRVPRLEAGPTKPHRVCVIRQYSAVGACDEEGREGGASAEGAPVGPFVCRCGPFEDREGEGGTTALKKAMRERADQKLKKDRKRARLEVEEGEGETKDSLPEHRVSLLARVLPLETLEQRLLEGGCNKSGYCMPRQIEDTLGPHALRVYAELRNLLGPNPRRDSPSQWLWHYEFCFGGADLTKSLEAKLEDSIRENGDFAFFEHADVALSIPSSSRHPLNRLMTLGDSHFVHLKASVPVAATEYPVAIWNGEGPIPKGDLVVLGVRAGEFLTDEEYREAVKDAQPNPVVEALRTVDILPWLLCPEDQAGLLEVGLASLQGGVGVQPESARFCRADSAVPPPVPSGLGMSLAKPRHHRPEVAWASDNFGRNEAHKTRACLRLRPGMGAVPLYGLHFTSVRKFNKLSFVLHTGQKGVKAECGRFAAWSDWPEMKETVRAHLVMLEGWPAYVYTNNPEVEVLPGDELAMNMHMFPPLLPNTWYYTNDLNHKRRAYVEAQRENTAVAGYTSPLWLQNALRSGACLSVEDLTEGELSDEDNVSHRTKHELTSKKGGRRRATEPDSDTESPVAGSDSSLTGEDECSVLAQDGSSAGSDGSVAPQADLPRTCRNHSNPTSSASCLGEGDPVQGMSRVVDTADSPCHCSRRGKDRTMSGAADFASGLISHAVLGKGVELLQAGMENSGSTQVQFQQKESYAHLVQRYVFPQIACRADDA